MMVVLLVCCMLLISARVAKKMVSRDQLGGLPTPSVYSPMEYSYKEMYADQFTTRISIGHR
jgi:hypothetical protein